MIGGAVAWEIFEREAGRYEEWYATARGRRVDRSERALLAWLVARLPGIRRVLEIGCGTGHFTEQLAGRGLSTIGLDRSPAMLREAARLRRRGPFVLADAHRLPLRDRAVDVAALIATLEFLDSPARALEECVRVAERGLVLVVLNRHSLGAAARRWPRGRHALLRHARDLSLRELRRMIERAAGRRLLALHWRCTLLPRPLARIVAPVPFGDVIGVAAELASPAPEPAARHGRDARRPEPD
jgi:ubiquinone/menaquinone biosynthesis C-methylase UbiE